MPTEADTRRPLLRPKLQAAGELDRLPFCIPHAVVRFIVAVTGPRLGETVPAAGSGTRGFLVESYDHLAKRVKTVANRKVLQAKSTKNFWLGNDLPVVAALAIHLFTGSTMALAADAEKSKGSGVLRIRQAPPTGALSTRLAGSIS